jgi:hypothetical protein
MFHNARSVLSPQGCLSPTLYVGSVPDSLSRELLTAIVCNLLNLNGCGLGCSWVSLARNDLEGKLL